MRKIFLLMALCLTTVFAAKAGNLQIYTEYKDGTLIYYYDDQMASRTGKTEPYNPADEHFIDYHDEVLRVKIHSSMFKAPLVSTSRMFYGGKSEYNLSAMEKIEGLGYLNTENVTDMSEMFSGCVSLSSVDLSLLNTDNVKYMNDMFANCTKLYTLDLSSFNTANVVNMQGMFRDCDGLKNLDLSNFNTENVTNMAAMFMACIKLTSLDLSSFNTAKVTNMAGMFLMCFELTELNLSSFNTANVANMEGMFTMCWALPSIDITSFNIKKVTNAKSMFNDCKLLTTIYCNDDWSKSAVNSQNMFKGCISLAGSEGTLYNADHIDKTYARPDEGTSKPGYFTTKKKEVYTVYKDNVLTYYCDELRHSRDGKTEIYDPVNNPVTARFEEYGDKVTKAVIHESMKDTLLTSTLYMFVGGFTGMLTKLTTIEGMDNLNTEKVTNMGAMFWGCSLLESIDLSNFKTGNVTDMSSMFADCSALKSLDLSSFNTSNVTNMNSMFEFCSALKSIDLSSFDIVKLKNTGYMFSNCSELTTIYCNDYWSKSTTLVNTDNMFDQCLKLVGGLGSPYSADHIDGEYARPDGGSSAPGYFTLNSTPIDNVQSDKAQSTKVLHDGQLFILRNGHTYDATGKEVR